MIIERIWTANSNRNFNYLVACPETGEALAVDPLDHEKCLAAARERGWAITQVLNTHEHGDHIGGNEAVIAATDAKLLAPRNAGAKIAGIDEGLGAGDTVRVGRTVEFRVLDTPGHTMSHICLYADNGEPVLICGDTLFNAGVGNCHSGDANVLFDTFAREIVPLPDATRIYPGHDYFANNLRFTLSREPDNGPARSLLAEIEAEDPERQRVSTLGLEREINTFLRLESLKVIEGIRELFPEHGEAPDDRSVFLSLRKLRNEW